MLSDTALRAICSLPLQQQLSCKAYVALQSVQTTSLSAVLCMLTFVCCCSAACLLAWTLFYIRTLQ